MTEWQFSQCPSELWTVTSQFIRGMFKFVGTTPPLRWSSASPLLVSLAESCRLIYTR